MGCHSLFQGIFLTQGSNLQEILFHGEDVELPLICVFETAADIASMKPQQGAISKHTHTHTHTHTHLQGDEKTWQPILNPQWTNEQQVGYDCKSNHWIFFF